MGTITKQQLQYLQDLRGEFENDNNGDRMSEWQHKFMLDQFERAEKYGETMFLSEKQWAQVKKAGNAYDLEWSDYEQKDFSKDIDDEVPF
jgi:hypothetical protein